MSVPDIVRQELREKLWAFADGLNWVSLSTTAKSRQYEAWTRDPKIGGVLSRYIPLSDVRVYLKDTLLKGFSQDRLSDDSVPYMLLGVSRNDEITERYIKPHGRALRDGRLICWGKASSWKAVVMAAYERAYAKKNLRAFGVIFTHAVGRYHQAATREMIEEAAQKLGIERVSWVE